MLNWATNEKGLLAAEVLGGLIVFEIEPSADGRWRCYVRGAHMFELNFEDVVNNPNQLKGFITISEAQAAAEDYFRQELQTLKF